MLQQGLAAESFVPRPIDLLAQLLMQTLAGGVEYLMWRSGLQEAAADLVFFIVEKCLALLGD